MTIKLWACQAYTSPYLWRQRFVNVTPEVSTWRTKNGMGQLSSRREVLFRRVNLAERMGVSVLGGSSGLGSDALIR